MQKSGIAAVEFLSRRGAVVRATDLKPLDELPQAREVLSRQEQKALGEPYRQEHERLVEKEEEQQQH